MSEIALESNIGTQPEKFWVAFATSSDPMWIYDLKTLAFFKVNEAAVRVYGFSEAEFLSMTVLDIRPGKDVEKFLHSWKHPHESKGDIWWHVGRDGTPFQVCITSRKLICEGHEAELVLAKNNLQARLLSHECSPIHSS